MKVKFTQEEYDILDDLLEDFLEEPPREYKRLLKNLKKFDDKIELEYIEILKLFQKYKENIRKKYNYQKALSYQLGLERGLEIRDLNEDEFDLWNNSFAYIYQIKY